MRKIISCLWSYHFFPMKLLNDYFVYFKKADGSVHMRKILLIIFVFISLGLVTSCQLNNDNELIVKVSFSNSTSFVQININFFVQYENEEKLKLVEKILSKASKVDGIVDMIEPEYDLEIAYANGKKERIHLWIGDIGERTILMYVDDTHTVYSISEEYTE